MLELIVVPQHERAAWIELRFDGDVIGEDGSSEADGLRDDAVEIDGAADMRAILAERQQLAGQVGGLFADVFDAGQMLNERMVRRHLRFRQPGQAHDDRQQIVEIMDRAARQPADQFQMPGLLQFQFQAALRRDVDHQARGADHFAVIDVRMHERQHRLHRSVLDAKTQLHAATIRRDRPPRQRRDTPAYRPRR